LIYHIKTIGEPRFIIIRNMPLTDAKATA